MAFHLASHDSARHATGGKTLPPHHGLSQKPVIRLIAGAMLVRRRGMRAGGHSAFISAGGHETLKVTLSTFSRPSTPNVKVETLALYASRSNERQHKEATLAVPEAPCIGFYQESTSPRECLHQVGRLQ
jgi:hypothetical protein